MRKVGRVQQVCTAHRYKHAETKTQAHKHTTQTKTQTQTQTHSVQGTSVHSRQMAEVELYSDGQYVKSDQEKRTVAAL